MVKGHIQKFHSIFPLLLDLDTQKVFRQLFNFNSLYLQAYFCTEKLKWLVFEIHAVARNINLHYP